MSTSSSASASRSSGSGPSPSKPSAARPSTSKPSSSTTTAPAAATPTAASRERPSADRVRARIRELLAEPARQIDRLGQAVRSGDQTLRALDRVSLCTQRLAQNNSVLVPLIHRFSDTGSKQTWFQRFIGTSIERQARFTNVCAEIEASMANGADDHNEIDTMIKLLGDEQTRIDVELAELDIDIAAGRFLISPAAAKLRDGLVVEDDHWQRFERRLANLDAMAAALQLTRRQYGVAASHARTIADRFDEIRHLLLPIWYQRMGFDLFAQRASGNQVSSAASTGPAAPAESTSAFPSAPALEPIDYVSPNS